MIEVRKYIPQIYNISRDFSIFSGIMQIILNELDVKSNVLLDIPTDSILPNRLSQFSEIKDEFRNLLKTKGTIDCLLYSVILAGGQLPSYEEELENVKNYNLKNQASKIPLFNDNELLLREFPERTAGYNFLVYYTKSIKGFTELHINIKDLSKINQDLLNELWYYIKPVNVVIVFEQYLPL